MAVNIIDILDKIQEAFSADAARNAQAVVYGGAPIGDDGEETTLEEAITGAFAAMRKPGTAAAAARRLLHLSPSAPVCVTIWREDDVLARAGALGIKLTDEQVGEVLRQMERYQNNEAGITWNTIDHYIQEVTEQ